MINAPIATIVAALLLPTLASAALVGHFSHRRQQRRQHASELWNAITARGPITAPSPWHPPSHPINHPGLVEVIPHKLQPDPPMHPWECEPIPAASPPPPSDGPNNDSTTVSTVSELVDEPPAPILELSDPPDPAERARVRRVYQQTTSQTRTIKQVWGISKGGGKRYVEARRRFRDHTADLIPQEAHYA